MSGPLITPRLFGLAPRGRTGAVEYASLTGTPAHLIPRAGSSGPSIGGRPTRGAGRVHLKRSSRNYFQSVLTQIRRRQHSGHAIAPAVEPQRADPMGENSDFHVCSHAGTVRPVVKNFT